MPLYNVGPSQDMYQRMESYFPDWLKQRTGGNTGVTGGMAKSRPRPIDPSRELLSKATGIGAAPSIMDRINALGDDDIMMGAIAPPMARVAQLTGRVAPALGVGQVLPNARDVAQLTSRLQANLSRVPTSAAKLLDEARNVFSFNPQQTNTMNRMYQESNPIFRRMQSQGMFRGAGTQR